ncbi:MAG: recombinase family protein [Clostridiales bacterium]|nr:recombinase family protein [Clostridiales bacterium]
MEAEAHGEGETLSRHERILTELAKKRRLEIREIYREIVSGDTIAARPVMQRLLQETGQGRWRGVLVMEVERLARGDTIDQGIVAQTFKFSNTLIITPLKDFDPSNEYDEEYFEFGLFMSRREYKTINRRLQRGRLASVNEGKYVAGVAPYGYRRVHVQNGKGFTLDIVPEEAEIVRLIYSLYTSGENRPDGTKRRLGVTLIARRLSEMKVPTRKGGSWAAGSVRDILTNPVYTGKLCWNRRRCVKKIDEGRVCVSRPRAAAFGFIIAEGIHPPVISEETFNLAGKYMSLNPPRPVPGRSTVKNPLAGLVVCGLCGRRMIRRPYKDGKQPDTLMCPAPGCKNVSSALYIVENRILQALEQWMGQYDLLWDVKPETEDNTAAELCRKALEGYAAELETIRKQLEKTYDLLEQGIYDNDTFLSRSRLLSDKISAGEAALESAEERFKAEIMGRNGDVNTVPNVNKLLEVYRQLNSPKAKNDMLKEMLKKVVYFKRSGGRWQGSPDDFEIHIYPILPNSQKKPLLKGRF